MVYIYIYIYNIYIYIYIAVKRACWRQWLGGYGRRHMLEEPGAGALGCVSQLGGAGAPLCISWVADEAGGDALRAQGVIGEARVRGGALAVLIWGGKGGLS